MAIWRWAAVLLAAAIAFGPVPAAAAQSPTVADCLQHPDSCGPSAPSRQQTKQTANQAADAVSASDVLRLIGATAFVLILLYAVLRWMSRRQSFVSSQKGVIEHLGGTSVGTNRSVQLIKVGRRLLVIGVGDSIQLLREIEDEEEINELLAQYRERLERMAEFGRLGSLLRGEWTGKSKRKNGLPPSFSALLAEEMKQMTEKRNEWLKRLKGKGTAGDE
ncbi:flagellar biosynthesis, FliO family protein [Geobacillus kaustophilus]|uniref:Flagellar biosynthesis, FliO family protein n=1 Tax=Geobacillus kaustophilus TaxID=1462 RepID=A0A0D8BSB6_GEOKU|nr:flagella biosynthesis regulatory protein FliZ [Geobacillus kaustophilus]KJE26282.1 flagellar biosynthesis, FliO family protein [Geobacillus kaustophilus]